ncbi:hypothetical protein HPB48_005743 [Haemaphysalis longicornis]|uniref:Uncharacterized protein n=1 Tax=Haemaphysalis longicornis TaxID=44386 RepID=A0A9J6FBW6_HAELO|nr:hypothetical protein HPB48_005743 [Haemaphysalis longicornis]
MVVGVRYIHLQPKEQIIANLRTTQPSFILNLDLEGALDNIKHTTILVRLHTLSCGTTAYNYGHASSRSAQRHCVSATTFLTSLIRQLVGSPGSAYFAPSFKQRTVGSTISTRTYPDPLKCILRRRPYHIDQQQIFGQPRRPPTASH